MPASAIAHSRLLEKSPEIPPRAYLSLEKSSAREVWRKSGLLYKIPKTLERRSSLDCLGPNAYA